jgi:superfamily II DNA/RNA helicase
MTELLTRLSQRRVTGTGRLKQTVNFTRFYDTLTDIVGRLRRADPGMLIGTYSGHGGQDVEPGTGRLVSVERDEVKHRFMRRQIDILICTDAAAEGLNLQTADVLVNFDLPWNPMKVGQRIGRIDRIGQEHPDISVLNLCYADSAEHIVYGRLLARLAEIGAIVGTQQLSLLPVTREEFQQLADKTLTATELEQRATERALWARHRTASMEMPPQDLYSTYLRLEQQRNHTPLPVDLDTLWETLAQSAYSRGYAAHRYRRRTLAPDLGDASTRGLPDDPGGAMDRGTERGRWPLPDNARLPGDTRHYPVASAHERR